MPEHENSEKIIEALQRIFDLREKLGEKRRSAEKNYSLVKNYIPLSEWGNIIERMEKSLEKLIIEKIQKIFDERHARGIYSERRSAIDYFFQFNNSVNWANVIELMKNSLES